MTTTARCRAARHMSTISLVSYLQQLISLFADFLDRDDYEHNAKIAVSALESLPPSVAAEVVNWLETVVDQIAEVSR